MRIGLPFFFFQDLLIASGLWSSNARHDGLHQRAREWQSYSRVADQQKLHDPPGAVNFLRVPARRWSSIQVRKAKIVSLGECDSAADEVAQKRYPVEIKARGSEVFFPLLD
jgi:hypothetical protein